MYIFSKDESIIIHQILESNVILDTSSFIDILKLITKSNKEFDILRYYIENILNDEDKQLFFLNILPFIIKMSYLCHNKDFKISNSLFNITKLEALSLIANMFLCTINMGFKNIYNSNETELNLDTFEDFKYSIEESKTDINIVDKFEKIEQIKFIYNYFKIMFNERIDRLDYKIIKIMNFNKSNIPYMTNNKLSDIQIFKNNININDSIQIIYNNQSNLIYPELLVYKFFKDKFKGSIQIYGLNKFANYTTDFKFKDIEYHNTYIYNFICLDNVNSEDQYLRDNKHLEILKVYNGLINININSLIIEDYNKDNNDSILNFLIYWLCASLNNKKINYYSKNNLLRIKIENMINKFKDKLIYELYLYIMQYEKQYLYSI